MPPLEKWQELDNSRPPAPASKENANQGHAAPLRAVERPIAKLSFLKPVVTEVPLEFPFEHPDLGAVHIVAVQRLTVGQVGDILDARQNGAPDLFDIYAAMTGLSAEVLRGLEAGDGERVTGACFDFLPQLLRPAQSG